MNKNSKKIYDVNLLQNLMPVLPTLLSDGTEIILSVMNKEKGLFIKNDFK